MPDDAGAPDGGAQVDFAVSDVVAVPALDFTPLALQLLDVKGELWVRRNDTWCGGAAPTRYETFFVVKKGTVVHVNACTSGCSGDPVP